MDKKILLILFIVFPFLNAVSQEEIIVSNTMNNSIEVKIFMQTIFTKEGINYYKTSDNGKNWVLLNEKPIFLATNKPSVNDYKIDNTLKEYVDLIDGVNPDQENALLDLTIIIKSVLSKSFAKYIGIMYEDKGVEKGETYKYKATIVNNIGKESIIAYSKSIIANDFIKAEGPLEIKINPFEKKIKLSWKPEEDRYFGVNVYRRINNSQQYFKVNGKPIIVSRIEKENGELAYPEFFFMEDSLKNNQTYYYKLEAIDYFGNISKMSEVFNTAPKDKTPPNPPVNLDKITKNDTVILTWDYNNVEAVGFNVFRSSDDENYIKINENIVDIQKRDFLIKEPVPGRYYYRIHAIDSSGNQGKSSKIFIEVKDLIPPSVVQNIIAKSDTGRVMLDWNNNIEKDLWGYLVYRRIENKETDEFVLLNTNPLKKASFIDTLAVNIRNKFEYSIVAIDLAYNKSDYSKPVSVRLPDITPPAKPYIKQILKDNNSIIIEWIANVDPDLSGYNIYRKQLIDTNKIIRKMNVNIIKKDIRRFSDRDFVEGVEYKYSLVAVDTSGNISYPSEEYSYIFPQTLTNDVKFKKAKGVYKKNKSVKLSWEINSKEVKGFVIFRKGNNKYYMPISGLVHKNIIFDKDIKEGKEYSYKIHAYLLNGIEIISEEISIK